MMQPDKGHGNLFQKFFSMNINTLEEDRVKNIAEKIESGRKDEELPQLTNHPHFGRSHRQDFHSKASRRREVPELGDPRSSIGFQNVINNDLFDYNFIYVVCLFFLFCFVFIH